MNYNHLADCLHGIDLMIQHTPCLTAYVISQCQYKEKNILSHYSVDKMVDELQISLSFCHKL